MPDNANSPTVSEERGPLTDQEWNEMVERVIDAQGEEASAKNVRDALLVNLAAWSDSNDQAFDYRALIVTSDNESRGSHSKYTFQGRYYYHKYMSAGNWHYRCTLVD